MNDMVPAQPVPQVPSLLNLIATTARDPTVDISKFETLLRMQREIIADEARLQFNKAMNRAQAEMQPIVRDAENTQTHSRYAKLETIDQIIRPIYTAHGFSLSFDCEPVDGASIRITCEVAHELGYSRSYHLESGLDSTGAQGKVNKTPLHALGSTVSYLRRYLTCMIFHVILTSDDDDGNAGGARAQRQDSPPPPPPPPRGWLDTVLAKLTQEADGWKWMTALLAAFASAPTLRDLDDLVALPVIQQTRAKAPVEAREKIDVAFNNATVRLRPTPQKTEPPRAAGFQNDADLEPDTRGRIFEAILIDADGEPQDRLFDNAREFARAFAALWQKANTQQRAALSEYNSDGLDAAHDDAADLLDPLMAAVVEQIVLPPIAVVEPPVERGKISWPAYVKAIKQAMVTLDRTRFDEWVMVQRETISNAPMAQRVLAVRAIADAAGTMDIAPPKWLGDLMRRPASQKSPPNEASDTPADQEIDRDEEWVNGRIAELAGISERAEFDQIIGSLAVRTVMARLRRDKPELFSRADAAFTAKHQALQGKE
jgi:ERF superfamily